MEEIEEVEEITREDLEGLSLEELVDIDMKLIDLESEVQDLLENYNLED